MSYRGSFPNAPRVVLLLSLIVSLALLALACSPAQAPTPAPTVAAPIAAATTPASAPTAEVAAVQPVAPEGGKYVEVAGLRLLIPKGNQFGALIIPPDPRPPRYGGTVVYPSAGDPPSIDPFHTITSQMQLPTKTFYERLIDTPSGPGTNPTVHAIIPSLAVSWETSDDFLTYTFHLRQGVKWHNLPPVNGRELDAEDVKFTWDLFKSQGAATSGFFNDVDRAEVVDKYTVVLHMKQVNLGMLANLPLYGPGYILPRESANFNRRLTAIGTGPFMVTGDYQYKVGLTQRRNPDYWGTDTLKGAEGNRLPYLDALVMVIIPDFSAQRAAFRSGKLDTGVSLTPSGVPEVLKTNPTTLVQETRSANHSTHGSRFRLDKAPWNDVRVRRALSLAINYDEWSQTTVAAPYNGYAGVPGLWNGRPNTIEALTADCSCPWYTYDPKRAKELLAEAGFPNGFATTFEFHPYTQGIAEIFELEVAYWNGIGVKAAIKALDLTVFRPNMDSGKWSELGFGFFVPTPQSIYGSLQPMVPGHPLNPNFGWLNDPQITAWVKEFEASYKDPKKQQDIYRLIRARFLDQVYSIGYPAGKSYSVYSPKLRNYQPIVGPLLASGLPLAYAWADEDWAFNK